MLDSRTASSLSRMLIVLVTFCAAFLSAAPARSETPQADFDIPAQALASALLKFCEQAGVQVSVSTAVVDGLSTTGIRGKLTPEAALSALLANTGLKFRAIGKKTYSVAQPQPKSEPPPRSGDTAGVSVALRLVSASGNDTAAAQDRDDETKADAATGKGIPEVLVKGTRSSNADIVRTEDDVQPYVVFDAEDIQQSMTPNLNEFLKSRLPMNSAYLTNAQGAGNPKGNTSSIDLRGMGADQTLILVNGRRMPGIAWMGQEFQQADINGIPLSSIERIEVLPSTAGGIYGGGATGGVINIILKRDYQGFEFTGRYDNTFDSDVAQRRLEGNAGFSLEDGKTHIMLTGSYSDGNEFKLGERDFISRARALMLRNDPAAFYEVPPLGDGPPIGATANIRSADGSPLVLKYQNRPLNSPIAYVPYGYGGAATDNGLAFLNTAGQHNLDLPGGLSGVDNTFMIMPKVTSAGFNARRTFTDRIEAFLDGSYMKNESVAHTGPGINTITLSPGAPNNPFQQAITVRAPLTGLTHGSAFDSWSETLGGTGGVIARLPRQWNLQAEYAWSRSRFTYGFSTQRLTGQGMGALFSGTLDVLRDDVAHPLDYSPYLFTPAPNMTQLTPFETRLNDATVRLAGPIFDLPGGSLILSTMIERREEESQDTVTRNYVQPTFALYNYVPSRGQTTESAYVEFTAPLISARNAGRFVRALEAQASYRRDSTRTHTVVDGAFGQITFPMPDFVVPDIPYEDSRVQADQYTLGLRYQPVESLALRMSYGAGVLPPSIAQLVPRLQQNWSVFGVTDPWRNNTPVGTVENYNAVGYGGLRPEESSSWSAGLIFTPAALTGLRISLDYLRLKKKDEIANIDAQVLMNLEDAFPGRIVRKELTAADILAGYERGEVETFDNGVVNIAHTNVEAIDFQLDYSWNTAIGAFRANLLGTRQFHLEQQALEGQPVYDSVGYLFGPLPWKGNGGLTYTREGWQVAWNAQYFDSQRIYDVTASPVTRTTSIRRQGSDTVPYQIYHDLFVRYRFDGTFTALGGLLANADLSIGISNVFDKSPPLLTNFSVQSAGASGYSFYGNPLMRRYSLSLKKSF